MNDSLLLQAFQGKNKRVPVWFMRQAGRYLPAYQDIRKKYSLEEMFRNPEIAAQVTFLPVGYLNVDAAVLFADILTLPACMGLKIVFDNQAGPVVKNPLQSISDVVKLHDFDDLSYVAEIIKRANAKLPQDVPLIGFAGSPFTVACYLIDGSSVTNFPKTLKFLSSQPKVFHTLLKKLTQNTIQYYRLQKKAGIKIFQLFDTWGGMLSFTKYKEFVMPYVQDIFNAVNLPSIYYLKNARHLLSLMTKIQADFLSVCHTVDFKHDTLLTKSRKGVQGNLHNAALYASYSELEKQVIKILKGAQKFKKFIFNVGHGVLPDVDPDKLRFVVETVHHFNWTA